MKHKHGLRTLAITNILALLLSGPMPFAGTAMAQGQPAAAPSATMPADLAGADQPWPRAIDAGGLRMMVYQPQVETWDGNILNLKAAVGIDVDAPNDFDRHFGAVWITARTEVDKDRGTVWLADVQVTRANFPTAPRHAQTVNQALDGNAGVVARVIALDQLQTSLLIAQQQRGQQQAIEVANEPPRILFSMRPAVLVSLDGEPVLRSVAPNLERVVNTNVLLLKEASGGRHFLRVGGQWATAPGLEGPWSIAYQEQPTFDRIKQDALSRGGVDLLDDDDRPGPYGTLPDIYISGIPAELLQTDGEPQYAPIDGTRLLYVQNTASDIFIDTGSQEFFVLVSGRWFHARSVNGPWAYVDSAELPPDFRRIPEQHPKGAVLVSIAGTPQAEEALIANTIPQTAAIDRQAATFTPYYDGQPQFMPVEGTALRYAVNAPVPVIMIDANTFYAVERGVWFTAPSSGGPWIVASIVPPVIYTIPAASPVYYATYVRVYSATPKYVYVGYTPGYYGTYASRRGTVVYGSGYRYKPWVGETYYARPATYGVGAGFAAGTFTGFALGLATAAIVGNQFWGPHWDGGRDRQDSRRDTSSRAPSSASRTDYRYSSNAYNAWGGQVVARQSTVRPAVAPTSLRDRRQQIDRLRTDSQASRERAAQARRTSPVPGTAPVGAAPVPAVRNDVFVGADGTPYREGPRGPERLDDRRNREAFDPQRRGVQGRPGAQPARAAPSVRQAAPSVVAPAATPAVVRPAAAPPAAAAPSKPAPVAAPAPRGSDPQRRAAEKAPRTQAPKVAPPVAAPAAAPAVVRPAAAPPAATAPAKPAAIAAPAPRGNDNQRRATEKAKQDQAPKATAPVAAPAPAPVPSAAAVPVKPAATARPSAAPRGTNELDQATRRANQEKVEQDQANKAAANRQRADEERAAKAAKPQADQKRQPDNAARARPEQPRPPQAPPQALPNPQAQPREQPQPQPQADRRRQATPSAQAAQQPAARAPSQGNTAKAPGAQAPIVKGRDRKPEDKID